MKTILITGASSGIGKATAKYFYGNNWNVIATMRNPSKEKDLKTSERMIVSKLDVTDNDTIKNSIDKGIKKFGNIDVIVNNAGYGLTGVFEATSEESIKKQYDVNVFGLMNVTRALLPHFREKNAGKIINISSMGGKITIPFFSIYHSTKFAVEGFSESVHYELAKLGIRVKIVEPGPIKTDFYDRSMKFVKGDIDDYKEYVEDIKPKLDAPDQSGAKPIVVAKTIFYAANDNSDRLRYTTDKVSKMAVIARKVLPDFLFFKFIKSQL